MRSVDFNDFEVFAVVAQEGSLRRAAARLGLSQPSVSQRVTRLESNLGTELMRRSTSGIRLTDAGQRLLPYLQQGVTLMHQAMAAVRETATAGIFDVSLDATLAPVLVPFVTRALTGIPVTLSNRNASVEQTLLALSNGDADIGFGHASQVPDGIVVEPFYKDEVCMVVSPDHPLTKQERVRIADVITYEVAVAMCVPGGEVAASHLTVAGIPPERLRRVEPASTATMLSLDCQHVSACLRSSLTTALDHGLLVELDVDDLPNWKVEISLFYRESDADLEPVRVLRDAVALAWERKTFYAG